MSEGMHGLSLEIPQALLDASTPEALTELWNAVMSCDSYDVYPVPYIYCQSVNVNGERNHVQRVLDAARALGVTLG